MISEYGLRLVVYFSILSTLGLGVPYYFSVQKKLPEEYKATTGITVAKNIVPLAILVFFWVVIGITPNGSSFVFPMMIALSAGLVFRLFYLQNRISAIELVAFFSICLLSTRWLWWKKSIFLMANWAQICASIFIILLLIAFTKSNHNARSGKFIVGVVGAVAVLLFLITYTSVSDLIGHDGFTLWHHVSAYVGPAELVAAGAVPLVDIPLQYGAGYAWVAQALGCSSNCWDAIVWTQHITNFIWAASIAIACVVTPRTWSATLCLFGIVAWFFGVVILTTYPPDLLPILGIPSTKGMRFWPLALMAAYALAGCRYGWFLKASSPGRIFGHCLWVMSVAWSPEGGLQVGLLWAGTLQWCALARKQPYLQAALYTLIELLAYLAAGVLILSMMFLAYYGQLPKFELYMLYLTIPWGEVHVDLDGALIFLVAFYVLSGFELYGRVKNSPKDWSTNSLYLGVLIATASLSYFINRPHDNNFLNIFLFFIPAILSLAADSRYLILKHVFFWCLAMPLIWSPFYGAASYTRYVKSDAIYADTLSEAWSFENPYDSSPVLNPNLKKNASKHRDLISLISSMKAKGDAYAIVDSLNITDAGSGFQPWSAFRNPSPWVFLPSEDRRSAIQNVADRLKSSGWLIVERGEYWVWNKIYSDAEIFLDFDQTYRRTDTIETEFYVAVHYQYGE